MTKERLKRKLAAILGADVEEYSRLMREDEGATIRTLTSYRAAMNNLTKRETVDYIVRHEAVQKMRVGPSESAYRSTRNQINRGEPLSPLWLT